MRYGEYREKMSKLAGAVDVAWRFRALILGALLLLIAVAVTFACITGNVYEKAPCPAEIVYGEPLSYRASAIFKEIRYEYRGEEGEWTQEAPRTVGSYFVRAVSSNGKTGKEHSFRIIPRDTEIGVNGDIVYGDLPQVSARLAYDDALTAGDFEIRYTDSGAEVTPKTDSFTVLGAGGEDVTDCYAFRARTALVGVLPRTVRVKVEDTEKVYDGAPLSSSAYELLDGLAEGDSLQAEFSASRTEAGESVNVPSFTVYHGSEDVTRFYEFQTEGGSLRVLKRELRVKVEDAEKVYDGTPLESRAYSVAEGDLLKGHRLLVSGGGTLTDAGDAENELSFTVSENGRDVSENYRVVFERSGKLIVRPRDVYVFTHSREWVYDGEPHSFASYEVRERTKDEGLLAGHSLELRTAAEAVDAGDTENALVFRVRAGERDVSGNYRFVYDYGTLTVFPRPVTFGSQSGVWTYDGAPHPSAEDGWNEAEKYSLIDGSVLPSHSVVFLGSATVTDATDAPVRNSFAVLIMDGERNVTENYDVSYRYGTLSVLPRPLKITCMTREFYYSGAPQYDEAFSLDEGTPVEGHHLTVIKRSVITEPSETENLLVFAVLTETGEDVTRNYDIAVTAGRLTVLPRPVEISTGSASWEYDGGAHVCHDFQIVSELGLVLDHTLSVLTDTPVERVGSRANALTFAVLDADGGDMSEKYELIVREDLLGTVSVYPRAVGIKTGSLTQTYSGNPVLCGQWEIVGKGLVQGHSLRLTGSAERVDAGEWENVLYFDVEDGAGEPIGDCYLLNFTYGVIEILPREVTLGTATEQFVYDGTPHRAERFSVLSEAGAAEGDEFYVSEASALIDAGSTPNRLIVSARRGEEDVTGNYRFFYSEGTLTVSPRPVTVRTATQSWYYDGEAHSDSSATADGLLEGHRLVVQPSSVSSVSDVGSVRNVCVYEDIVEGAVSKMRNYLLEYEYGTLTVLPRPITVQTEGMTWEYDGEGHSHGAFSVRFAAGEGEGLVKGHTARLLSVTTIFELGSVENVLRIAVYDGSRDVTGKYAAEYDYGTLEIVRRPLRVATESGSWLYDGEPHTKEGYSLLFPDEDLLAGDKFEPVYYASATEAGTTRNRVGFRVLRGGEDVSRYYRLDESSLGMLEILPRPLVVRTDSASRGYDGEPLSAPGFRLAEGTLASSAHVLRLLSEFSVSDAGRTENALTVGVFEGEKDVSANYRISYECGILEILPRAITVETSSKVRETPYDGTPFSDLGYVISGRLVRGHSAAVGDFTARVYAGSEDNVLEIMISDGEGRDVTRNYAITYRYGTLTVPRRPVSLLSASAEFFYDGEAHSCREFSLSPASPYPFAEGEEGYVRDHSEIKEVGGVPNKLDVGVRDKAGRDVTANYEVSYPSYGELRMRYKIVIRLYDLKKTYDGTPLSFRENDWYADAPDGLSVRYRLQGSITEASEEFDRSGLDASAVTVSDRTGRAIGKDDYRVFFEGGGLTVEKRKLVITSASVSQRDEGVPLRDGTWRISFGSLAPGQRAEVTVSGVRNGVGSSANTISSVRIFDGSGRNVTANYDIVLQEGILELT